MTGASLRAVLRAALVALALAGCGGVAKGQTTAETARPGAPAAAATADQAPRTAADPARLTEQVARIAGELSELQNAVAKLIASSRQQEDQLTYLRRRLEELESLNRNRLPAAPSGFAPSAPAAAPPPLASATTMAPPDLYRAGVEKLQAKDLDAAILSFNDLIVTYPDHSLRESAQFLMADIFYTQKNFREALAELEALIAAVPRGEKVPDALVKIGLCQKDLGDTERAKRTWERVVRDYPASVAARQARVLLRN